MAQAVAAVIPKDKDNILIVEDNQDVREALQALFELSGYHVRTANNGREALDEASSQLPSLILLDMMMPVMDGWQFLQKRKLDHDLSQVPVVVVSAASSEKLPKADDSVHFLNKPFDFDKLLTYVERLHKHSA